jgi:hypothetical protein
LLHVAASTEDLAPAVRAAYDFLLTHGAINFGLSAPPQPAPAAAEGGQAAAQDAKKDADAASNKEDAASTAPAAQDALGAEPAGGTDGDQAAKTVSLAAIVEALYRILRVVDFTVGICVWTTTSSAQP